MGKEIIYHAEFKAPVHLGTIYELGSGDGRYVLVANPSRNLGQTIENLANANTAAITIEGKDYNYEEFRKVIDSCEAIFRDENAFLKAYGPIN